MSYNLDSSLITARLLDELLKIVVPKDYKFYMNNYIASEISTEDKDVLDFIENFKNTKDYDKLYIIDLEREFIKYIKTAYNDFITVSANPMSNKKDLSDNNYALTTISIKGKKDKKYYFSHIDLTYASNIYNLMKSLLNSIELFGDDALFTQEDLQEFTFIYDRLTGILNTSYRINNGIYIINNGIKTIFDRRKSNLSDSIYYTLPKNEHGGNDLYNLYDACYLSLKVEYYFDPSTMIEVMLRTIAIIDAYVSLLRYSFGKRLLKSSEITLGDFLFPYVEKAAMRYKAAINNNFCVELR